jgi:hypothetical protein
MLQHRWEGKTSPLVEESMASLEKGKHLPTTQAEDMSDSSMSFLGPSSLKFGPRIGKLILSRPTGCLEIVTPGFLATTTRGLIPHLSRDHVHMADSIRWINIPFESLYVLVLPYLNLCLART